MPADSNGSKNVLEFFIFTPNVLANVNISAFDRRVQCTAHSWRIGLLAISCISIVIVVPENRGIVGRGK